MTTNQALLKFAHQSSAVKAQLWERTGEKHQAALPVQFSAWQRYEKLALQPIF
jgi:hypothetical protein